MYKLWKAYTEQCLMLHRAAPECSPGQLNAGIDWDPAISYDESRLDFPADRRSPGHAGVPKGKQVKLYRHLTIPQVLCVSGAGFTF